MNRKKKFMMSVVLLCVVVVVVLFVNWRYPFSYVSLSQSINYQPGKGLVQEYIASIERIEKLHASSSSSNLMENRTEFILDHLNQKLFTDPNGTSIKRTELEQLFADTQEIRYLLIELAFREDYSELGDSFLQAAIHKIVDVELDLLNVISTRYTSKKQIERSLRNLHVAFRSTLDYYESFYDEYTNKQS